MVSHTSQVNLRWQRDTTLRRKKDEFDERKRLYKTSGDLNNYRIDTTN